MASKKKLTKRERVAKDLLNGIKMQVIARFHETSKRYVEEVAIQVRKGDYAYLRFV